MSEPTEKPTTYRLKVKNVDELLAEKDRRVEELDRAVDGRGLTIKVLHSELAEKERELKKLRDGKQWKTSAPALTEAEVEKVAERLYDCHFTVYDHKAPWTGFSEREKAGYKTEARLVLGGGYRREE